METARSRLLDAALEVLGQDGGGALTVRAVQDRAGLTHGSVRHHFKDRAGLLRGLFDHLATRESAAAVPGADPAATLAHWLGPGRTLTLARYELFLMAARDPALRAPLVAARERFVAHLSEGRGREEATMLVAALDGLLLDALVRGEGDEERLRALVRRLGDRAASAGDAG
jgi:AcrR family transcriptional regulator